MADQLNPRCHCARCRACGLMGPLMLITIGSIFLVGRFTHIGFFKLWPLILIVAGVVLCVQFYASRDGHVGS